MTRLLDPFRAGGRIHRPLAALFLLINAIVLGNALRHDPGIGYDARAHLDYAETLASGRLPGPDDTYEYFSPPLPYALPAALHAMGAGMSVAARAGLLVNAVLSLLLTWSLLAFGRLMRPGTAHVRLAALLLLGSLPVYYKSFAFLRGEPFVAALGLYAIYRTARSVSGGETGWSPAIVPGALLGLALLSRQWAAFIVAGCLAFALAAAASRRGAIRPCLARIAVSLGACAVVGGWFYAELRISQGSAASFNRRAAPRFSFSNQPLSFYTDLGLERLFSDPVKGAFPNRLIPVFYSETWGDYWGYFSVYGRNARSGRYLDGFNLFKLLEGGPAPEWLETNRFTIAPYLGRVNLVGLLPTGILLAGVMLGARESLRFSPGRPPGTSTLLFAILAFSAAGYLWFLVAYPVPGRGTTIKATYMLHAFPLAALLAGDLLARTAERSVALYRTTLAAVGICGLHSLPLFLTRFAL